MSAKWPGWLRELSAAFAKDRTDENRMLFSDGVAAWRKEMHAAGLCVCGQPLAPGHGSMCIKCAVKQNFRVEDRRERLMESGDCPRCGQRQSKDGAQLCEPCAVAHAGLVRAALADKREKGLCLTCRAPTKGKGVKCYKHRVADSIKQSSRFKERREAGLCAHCSSPSPNKYLCPTCREKHNKGRRKTPSILDAMKVVLEYETEWFVTGMVVKDERYLLAKHLVESKAI